MQDDITYVLLGLSADIQGRLADLDSSVAEASWELSLSGLDGDGARGFFAT